MKKNYLILSIIILLISSCTVNKVLYRDSDNYVSYEYDKKYEDLKIKSNLSLMETDKSEKATFYVKFNYYPELHGEKITMSFFIIGIKGRCFENNRKVHLLVDGQPVQYEGKLTYASETVIQKSYTTEHTDKWSENFDIELSKKELDVLSNSKRIEILQLGDKNRSQLAFAFSDANIATIKNYKEAVDNYEYYLSQHKK